MTATIANSSSLTSGGTTTAPTTSITGTVNGNTHNTKIDLQAAYQALISGLAANYQPTDTFLLPSGTVTRDALIAQFQGFISVTETTKSANQSWREAVQAERSALVVVAPVRQAVRSVIQGRYGASATQLAQFGFSPRKATVRKAATKAVAVMKMKATREARSTKGKVQKKDIKGAAPAVTVEGTSVVAVQPVAAAPVVAPAAVVKS